MDSDTANHLLGPGETDGVPLRDEGPRQEGGLDHRTPQGQAVGVHEHGEQHRTEDPQVGHGALAVAKLPDHGEKEEANSRQEAAMHIHPNQHRARKDPKDLSFTPPDPLQSVKPNDKEQVGEHLATDEGGDSRVKGVAEKCVEENAGTMAAPAQLDRLSDHHEDGADEQALEDEEATLPKDLHEGVEDDARTPLVVDPKLGGQVREDVVASDVSGLEKDRADGQSRPQIEIWTADEERQHVHDGGEQYGVYDLLHVAPFHISDGVGRPYHPEASLRTAGLAR